MLKKTTNKKVSYIKKKETPKPYYGSLSDLKKKDPIIKKKETPKHSFVISSNITKRRPSTIGSIMRRK
jgi:hypothetical protein